MKVNRLIAQIFLFAFLLLPGIIKADFDPTHVYKIVNKATGLCVEVGGSDRYQSNKIVNAWPYWGGANQQWQFHKIGRTRYKIVNRNSGHALVMDDASIRYYGNYFNVVRQKTYDYLSEYHHWLLQQVIGGYLFINSGVDNGSVSPGRLVHNRESDPSGLNDGIFYSQSANLYTGSEGIWEIVDVSANQVVYQVINSLSYKALSATADDNRVTQWTNWSLAGQQWSFEPVGDDPDVQQYPGHKLWAVRVRSTGQILEIGGSEQETMKPGRNANVWDFWNTDLIRSHQLWRILDDQGRDFNPNNGAGPYHLLNVRTNLALEIGGNGNELYREDRHANQWYYFGQAKQKWYIQYVSQNRGGGTTAGPSGPLAAKTAEQAANQLRLYPNPATSVLHLTVPGNTKALRVTVTDMRGAIQVKARYMGNGQLDIAELAAGIYVVSVSDGYQIYHQKFDKQ